jgi:hypothetical protein
MPGPFCILRHNDSFSRLAWARFSRRRWSEAATANPEWAFFGEFRPHRFDQAVFTIEAVARARRAGSDS